MMITGIIIIYFFIVIILSREISNNKGTVKISNYSLETSYLPKRITSDYQLLTHFLESKARMTDQSNHLGID